MKNSKKGFMLTETLVVSTLVSVVLVSLYLQFSTVVNNFNKSFKNNNVNNLYAVYYISYYIKKADNGNVYNNLKSTASSNGYAEVDFSCQVGEQYCGAFQDIIHFYGLNDMDSNNNYVGKILLVPATKTFTADELDFLNDYNFSEYIRSIKSDNDSSSDYRLIVKFDNLEYANLVVVG